MFEQYLSFLFQAPFWEYQLWSNSLKTYSLFIVDIIFWLIAFKALAMIILARLKFLAKKTSTDLDDQIIEVIHSIKPPFYSFIGVYLAALQLALPEKAWQVLNAILIIVVVAQVIRAVRVMVDYGMLKKFGDEAKTKSMALLVGRLVSLGLWIIGILLILSNLGVNITSLIAGLGIGGLALALAAQNILGDLFSAFTIYFDKPFEIGDFIVVGDKAGTVQHIGIKSTRIKSLDGEEIVISNQELTSAQIRNFKKLKERRVIVGFGVTYDTPNKKMEIIPKLVKEIVDEVGTVRFDRCNFNNFADSSLNYELVFYVDSSDYNEYMHLQEKILLSIKERLEKEKIEMAFPTRTIYMHKG